MDKSFDGMHEKYDFDSIRFDLKLKKDFDFDDRNISKNFAFATVH